MDTVFRPVGREFIEFLRARNCQVRVEVNLDPCDELDWDDMTDEQKDEAYWVYFGEDR